MVGCLDGGDQMKVLEMAAVALSPLGETRGGERLEVAMLLSPENHANVMRDGVVFQLRMALPAGRYQLRVAGRDVGSGRIGSVIFNLDVSDFWAVPLAMSGILVTAEEAGQLPNPRPDPEIRSQVPTSPLGTRTFKGTDQLALFGEIYDDVAAQPHKVVITTTVQGHDGRVLVRQEQERSSLETGALTGIRFVSKIPLHSLRSGTYLATVEARSMLNPGTSVRRATGFRVE
jgi:hypothetical protein